LVSFQECVIVPAHVVLHDAEGKSVLLNPDGERYFGLDQVGARIWAVRTAASSIQDAYEALLAERDVAPRSCGRTWRD
jgi:hypothetical protein